jgi:tetratricopeptide (TPR) repeat protein
MPLSGLCFRSNPWSRLSDHIKSVKPPVWNARRHRTNEGIAENKRGQQLDPLSLDTNVYLGVNFYSTRHYDEATQQLKKTLDIAPDFWFAHAYLGRTNRALGRLPGAISELQKAQLLSGGLSETSSRLGVAYATQGEKAKMRDIPEKLKRQIPMFLHTVLRHCTPILGTKTTHSNICKRPTKAVRSTCLL